MVVAVARVEAVACDSLHEAAWLERNLLEERMGRWNRTAGGQETPGYLVLDDRGRAPGVRMTHRPVPGRSGPGPTALPRVFGPYLGGSQIRLAISGLHRAYPLAYTSEGLSGAERDLAAKRGVRPADRGVLAAAVGAVLEREAAAVAAVLAELEQARDRAAGDLAFERAGAIQDEIKALAWITAPQRATTADGGSETVHGWAGGLLVSFAIRDGRMCEWTQRRCSPAIAAARLAESPPAWSAFAHRNAELAASLAC
jgi:excinuclease ABC subunit C